MQHHFTVPVPVDVAWQALLDPERVAPCMPGATLTKAEGNEFAGSVKVKLGPVTLLYKGTGVFSETDEQSRKVVIDASGKDSRGNGTAAATVTASLTDEGEQTQVTVDTDLKVTGKPAQLGRGLISEVGGKILGQFAECLADRLTGGGEAESSANAGSSADGTSEETGTSTGTSGGPEQNGDKPAADDAQGSDGSAAKTGVQAPQQRSDWRVTGPAKPAEESARSANAHEEPARRADAVVAGGATSSGEAIDLLDTAGAPVLKRVAPAAAALIGAFVVIRLLRKRKSGRG
nr:SRPBCC family protein [Saccharopolyspora sp. HNM0983]